MCVFGCSTNDSERVLWNVDMTKRRGTKAVSSEWYTFRLYTYYLFTLKLVATTMDRDITGGALNDDLRTCSTVECVLHEGRYWTTIPKIRYSESLFSLQSYVIGLADFWNCGPSEYRAFGIADLNRF